MPMPTSLKPIAVRIAGIEQESMQRRGELVRMASSTPSRQSILQGFTGFWTIAEYDPTTGDVLHKYDRGRRRSQISSNALRDQQVLLSSDGYLYAVGSGYINRDSGILVKWDPDSGERMWDSDRGAHTGPLYASDATSVKKQRIAEASDGYIWALGTDTSNHCVGRFDPETGAQTHKFALASSSCDAVIALPSNGEVLVAVHIAIGGKYLFKLDATATETASHSTFFDLWELSPDGSKIALARNAASGLRILDTATLTVQTSRSPVGAEAYTSMAFDGTTLWVTTTGGATPKIRAYDATNLATENWNADVDAGATASPARLIKANGALYGFGTRMRKFNLTTGAEIWESPGSGIAPTGPGQSRLVCAVGSDFAVVVTADANEQVWCLNDSDGTVRWFDEWNDDGQSVHVTAGGRVFVSGGRIGP